MTKKLSLDSGVVIQASWVLIKSPEDWVDYRAFIKANETAKKMGFFEFGPIEPSSYPFMVRSIAFPAKVACAIYHFFMLPADAKDLVEALNPSEGDRE